MDCEQAQELIIESPDGIADLENHLGGCEACRRFSEIQARLDMQLCASIAAPPLSAYIS